jgi:hypothetical protein
MSTLLRNVSNSSHASDLTILPSHLFSQPPPSHVSDLTNLPIHLPRQLLISSLLIPSLLIPSLLIPSLVT